MSDLEKVRQALRNRMRTNSTRFAKALQVPTGTIDDFAYNDGELSPEVLASLIKEMWDGALTMNEFGELVQTQRPKPRLFVATHLLPPEMLRKPPLSKTERTMPAAPMSLERGPYLDPKWDKNFRPRREQTNVLP